MNLVARVTILNTYLNTSRTHLEPKPNTGLTKASLDIDRLRPVLNLRRFCGTIVGVEGAQKQAPASERSS